MNISRLYEKLDVQFQRYFSSNCMAPECDGIIKYEKIPSKEELGGEYYIYGPKQQRQFAKQYKIA